MQPYSRKQAAVSMWTAQEQSEHLIVLDLPTVLFQCSVHKTIMKQYV